MSFDEWTNLPEVGDVRNKRQRNPRMEKSVSLLLLLLSFIYLFTNFIDLFILLLIIFDC